MAGIEDIVKTMPGNVKVVILSIRHKWVYICYINPKDGLAETGWVLKKYLYSAAKKTR